MTGGMKGTAMRAVFQQELQEVQERLVEIASLVEASIENATRAFNESNVALADTVIADIKYRQMVRKERLPAIDAWLARNRD